MGEDAQRVCDPIWPPGEGLLSGAPLAALFGMAATQVSWISDQGDVGDRSVRLPPSYTMPAQQGWAIFSSPQADGQTGCTRIEDVSGILTRQGAHEIWNMARICSLMLESCAS